MKPESSFDGNRHLRATARGAPGRRWTAFAAACSLSIGCLAATADSAWEANWPLPSTSTSAAAADPPGFERWSEPDLSIEMIDTLRRNARAGDVDAAVALTGQLIDRYERSGTDDALFEAVVWIDRYHGNERLAQSGLIARVQQRDCRHKVLRLHLLCDIPE